jgi:hypothetical protein
MQHRFMAPDDAAQMAHQSASVNWWTGRCERQSGDGQDRFGKLISFYFVHQRRSRRRRGSNDQEVQD